MVVAYHLGRCLEMECGRQWLGGFCHAMESDVMGTKPRSPDKRQGAPQETRGARSTFLEHCCSARCHCCHASLGGRSPHHAVIALQPQDRVCSTSTREYVLRVQVAQAGQAMREWPRYAAP